MNWLENASVGLLAAILLAGFFATGWVILKLCDLAVAIGAVFARWRAECEEPEDFAERDTVPPEQWIPAPPGKAEGDWSVRHLPNGDFEVLR